MATNLRDHAAIGPLGSYGNYYSSQGFVQAPTGATLQVMTTPGEFMQINWDYPYTPDPDSFSIEKATSGSGPWSLAASSITGASRIYSNITNASGYADGVTYYFRVKAIKNGVASSYSNVVSGMFPSFITGYWQEANHNINNGFPVFDTFLPNSSPFVFAHPYTPNFYMGQSRMTTPIDPSKTGTVISMGIRNDVAVVFSTRQNAPPSNYTYAAGDLPIVSNGTDAGGTYYGFVIGGQMSDMWQVPPGTTPRVFFEILSPNTVRASMVDSAGLLYTTITGVQNPPQSRYIYSLGAGPYYVFASVYASPFSSTNGWWEIAQIAQ